MAMVVTKPLTIKVEEGDTLGEIASAKGLKGKAKADFIRSVMELNNIKDARFLQIGDLKLPGNSVFSDSKEAVASGTSAEGSTEQPPAPKPSIGKRFANWTNKSTARAVESHNEAVANVTDYARNHPNIHKTAQDMVVNTATTQSNEKIAALKGFSFGSGKFNKAMDAGDEAAALPHYVKDVNRLAKGSIKKDDTDEDGALSEAEFIVGDTADATRVGLKADTKVSKKMFAARDLDGDGKIDRYEQGAFLAAVDRDPTTGQRDGRITVSDYLNFRSKLADEGNKADIQKKLTPIAHLLGKKAEAKVETKELLVNSPEDEKDIVAAIEKLAVKQS